MPKLGIFKLDCIAKVEELKAGGCTWNQIAASLSISYNQVINIAERHGLRGKSTTHLFKPKGGKPKVPRAQAIPRGVSTLPPLPSLQLPFPKIEGK